MAKRQFHDSGMVLWDVWDVQPTDMPARPQSDQRMEPQAPRAPGEQGPGERGDEVPLLDPELAQGWLCFQSRAERRRFAPIPPQWLELPDGVLRVMLDIASPVSAPVPTPISTPVSGSMVAPSDSASRPAVSG